MRLIIEDTQAATALWVASYIRKRINDFKPTADRPFVLGLPTGNTPLLTYKKLIEFYQEKTIRCVPYIHSLLRRSTRSLTEVMVVVFVCSFEHVVTFNMDEYVGLPKTHPESYHSFMWTNLFQHIDIK
jgi:glucosamine-6-phosphate deaminase